MEMPKGAKFCPRCGTRQSMTSNKKEAEDSPVEFIVQGHGTPVEETTTKPRQATKPTPKPAPNPAPKPAQKPAKRRKADKEEEEARMGCGTMITIFFVGALIVGAIAIAYTHFFHPKNPLIPEDEEQIDSTAILQEEDEAEINDNIDGDAKEAQTKLRSRVQNIYRDVLQQRQGASYERRYCTASLTKMLGDVRQIKRDSQWVPGGTLWLFATETENPTLESVNVSTMDEEAATVKIKLRLRENSQEVNYITLQMKNEEGAWLVDDFISNGKSIKRTARSIIEIYERSQEIIEDAEDELMENENAPNIPQAEESVIPQMDEVSNIKPDRSNTRTDRGNTTTPAKEPKPRIIKK